MNVSFYSLSYLIRICLPSLLGSRFAIQFAAVIRQLQYIVAND